MELRTSAQTRLPLRLALGTLAAILLTGCSPGVYTANVSNLTESAVIVCIVDRSEEAPSVRAAMTIPPRHRGGLGPFAITRDRAELQVTPVGGDATQLLVLDPGVTELEAHAAEDGTGAPVIELRPPPPGKEPPTAP